ncbi:DUF6602 domain-containing protein [Streptomyces sp. NPDC057694]|uniref:DUF6602 domain-containing protein n=1 Tax=Streptomyces sp. NPDC057694 TaxID=3346216 RepID=UPI0036B43C84
MSVVEEYWNGVLRRLQAEVDVFNRLIKHWGERGKENELSLARLLENLIPKRYGVGSGMVIDRADSYSQQTDIIVYDQANEPGILAQSTQVLFPVENVRACIEVKTSVNKAEIQESGKKRASLRALSSMAPILPLFHLVGYKPSQEPETIARHLAELSEEEKPDLFCVIDAGMVGGRKEILEQVFGDVLQGAPAYVIGVAHLHLRAKGQRVEGQYMEPPDDFTEPSLLMDGSSYPIIRTDGKWRVAEPSRALLIFCAALVNSLATHDGHAPPAITHYLSPATLDLVHLS